MRKIAEKLTFGLPIALAAFACCSPANAQQQPPPLSVKPLNGGVYWTQGGAGGNTGIIVGKDGVIVVDAKTTPASAKEMLAEIAKITPKPVTTVILTHSDGDHVNGLAAFPAGLTIISQENCKKEMEASANSRNPAPQDRLPTKTVATKENVTINGVKLTLLHYAPAHTSGDLMVYLPEQKIVFTGDIIATNQPYTLIHAEKHGSSEGWIQTVKGLTSLNADSYVPGHGDLQTKAQVQERLARVQARRDEIKKLVAQGKSLDQIKEALGEKDTPAAPGAPQFPSYTTVVYNELTKKS
ncbi:MAG TPA: MBL fold metallo-hydrolase [Candidatus Acidoferrales bacterium]|jgi:glyoxylase-like metal-dependent hydrolase (beta-lactamase superfamily II)|nr:MBL fold metallo-hydrolase [Candidatus Acidoferrales bacterium]